MKRFIASVVTIVALVLLVSCGGGKSSASKAAADDTGIKLKETGKNGTLTFAMWGTPPEKSAVYQVLQAFQKENPEIGIKVIHVDFYNYNDKLKTMIAGGTPPDVFYCDRPYFYDLASRGALLNLDEYVKQPEFNAGDFYPILMKAFQFSGNQYGIPKDWTTFALYYNKDMFDKEGLKYPDSNWTWTDLSNAAAKLTKGVQGSGRIDQYGFIMETWADWYYNFLRQNGGEIFDEKGNWVFSKGQYLNQNAEALTYLADLVKKRWAPDPTTAKQLGAQQAFISGQAAMCIYGRWVELDFKAINKFKWDYTVLPHSKKRASVYTTVAYAISANTKNPDASWKLIQFLTSEQGQYFTAKTGMAIPSRQSLVAKDSYLKSPEVLANQPQLAKATPADDPFIQQIPYAVPIPVGPVWLETRAKLDEQLEDVFLGNKDAKSVILKLDAIVDDIVKSKNQGPSVGQTE
jgi:multiple sugar transport system substrate-binding protein